MKMKKKILPLILVGTFLLASPLLFAQETSEESEEEVTVERTDMTVIQLKDPLQALDEKIQKYFNIDTTYDYDEETTEIWTTLGFRKSGWDLSFTWDQQVNPSEGGQATVSFSCWW